MKVHVAIVPLARDQLFPALQNGQGRPRRGRADDHAGAAARSPTSAMPTRTGVSEDRGDDEGRAAAGQRRRSLGPRGVRAAQQQLLREPAAAERVAAIRRGKPPVTIKEAPEELEDDDLLEMVNAGLVDVTIVDDFVAEFWQQVFPNLQLHPARRGADRRRDRRRPCARTTRSCATPSTSGSRRMVRGRRSATDGSSLPAECELREERRRRGGAAEVSGAA